MRGVEKLTPVSKIITKIHTLIFASETELLCWLNVFRQDFDHFMQNQGLNIQNLSWQQALFTFF